MLMLEKLWNAINHTVLTRALLQKKIVGTSFQRSFRDLNVTLFKVLEIKFIQSKVVPLIFKGQGTVE